MSYAQKFEQVYQALTNSSDFIVAGVTETIAIPDGELYRRDRPSNILSIHSHPSTPTTDSHELNNLLFGLDTGVNHDISERAWEGTDYIGLGARFFDDLVPASVLNASIHQEGHIDVIRRGIEVVGSGKNLPLKLRTILRLYPDEEVMAYAIANSNFETISRERLAARGLAEIVLPQLETLDNRALKIAAVN